MGNTPSGFHVLRQPPPALASWNKDVFVYTFDLKSCSEYQIKHYFLKPLKTHAIPFEKSDDKQLTVHMNHHIYERLFQQYNPQLSIIRTPSSSFSEGRVPPSPLTLPADKLNISELSK